jgi:hypothetical protein
MTAKARTAGRIARIAAEQGWHEWSTRPGSSYLRRGTTSINLGFSRSGQLVHAMRYRPGEAEIVRKGRLAFVVGWLTDQLG